MRYALKNTDNRSAIHGSHFCFFKSGPLRPPFCALGTSFYTVSEGRDLMTYISDNYTSYSVPSPLRAGKNSVLIVAMSTDHNYYFKNIFSWIIRKKVATDLRFSGNRSLSWRKACGVLFDLHVGQFLQI